LISELKEMGMQEDDIADLNELASMMHKFVSDIIGKITFAVRFGKVVILRRVIRILIKLE
jgi:hypothetical protein